MNVQVNPTRPEDWTATIDHDFDRIWNAAVEVCG
jgi:hypothetical protein